MWNRSTYIFPKFYPRKGGIKKFEKIPKTTPNLQAITGNFSAEKNGVEPEEIQKLATHIRENCDNLKLEGLMTIGKYGYDPADGPNPDFVLLKNCRDKLAKELQINWQDLQLSMGMSTDFEQAVRKNVFLI